VIAFRPEASVIYANADSVLTSVLERLRAAGTSGIRLMVCDLSASPYLDLAGSRMLHELHGELADRGIVLRIAGHMDGRATCCEPTAWARKLGDSTGS
jgi:sulfate permease, SulP family